MIRQPCFVLEPWCIRETELDLTLLAQTESIFALANGNLGLRGNLDEGEPYGLPGTYLNSVYEHRPLPYAEAGFGYPESGQAMINVTNGKVLRLLVDDEPFDVRYGSLRWHERVLDLRAGTLTRIARWVSPAGQEVEVTSVRLVSFSQRSVAAIWYEVEAIDDAARVVVQSELVANEPLPHPGQDPRVAAALDEPLVGVSHGSRGDTRVELVHRTVGSGLHVAAGADHIIEGRDLLVTAECDPDIGRVTIGTVLEPGEKLRVVKFLAYGWSAVRSEQALSDQVAAALTAARQSGWEGLLAEQSEYLGDFWERSAVDVDGDTEIQQAVRFGLFHVLQSGARAEARCIPAKGITGTGYDGHAFWDTEAFVLPVLTYTVPSAARSALEWRHSTLPAARRRATTLGLKGAAFPWRTIAGEECSTYWPAGTAAFHINADIADAVLRYVDATEDEEFDRTIGLEILVETARLWASLGHFDHHGRFRIAGVTGPDEYSAVVDDNVYTNLMAQQNLAAAADATLRYRTQAAALNVHADEAASWRAAANGMFVAFDEDLGVNPQAAGFTAHQVWDFENTPAEHYPLMLNYPYFDLYRKQVTKQADLVLAMHRRGDAFTAEQKERNFSYYEALTVRDSSLSAPTQAIMAAEVGYLELASAYLAESALMDLNDLHRNTGDGLHIAALAGGWSAIVAGFGGFRARRGKVSFAPCLAESLARIRFNLTYRDRQIAVTITPTEATYELRTGAPLEVTHHGEPVTLSCNAPVTKPIPAVPYRTPPLQPFGREPLRHHPDARHGSGVAGGGIEPTDEV